MFKETQYEKDSKKSGFLKSLPNGKKMQNGLRKFGAFMVGMIMPVIGLIIAWGFLTAILLGAKTIMYPAGTEYPPGFDVNAEFSKDVFYMDQIIGFGINSVIPIMIGYMGGRQIHERKGAIIGVIATIGTIIGSFNPIFNEVMVSITGDQSLISAPAPAMILGAMITGPLAAFAYKHIESLWIDRMPSGYEMLINNFSIGLIGLALMIGAFWSIAILAAVIQAIFFLIITAINETGTLFLMAIFVEIEKVLFLNNAVNHGIFGPLGLAEVGTDGQSAYFFLDPNPGTGMGLLLAYYLFSNKQNKAQSLAAMPVHFIGGIHEVSYPFILTKPINLIAMIAGGMFAAGMYQIFDVGGLFTPSPGSIIMNYVAVNPEFSSNYIGLTIAIFGSMAISCSITSTFIIIERMQRNERIYFNPVVALRMSKINNLINQKTAFMINKKTPIASIKYQSEKTNKVDEWEIVTYADGTIEEFIIQGEKSKVVKFKYVTEKNRKGKDVKYLIRKFATGKTKKIKIRSYDQIIAKIDYEKRKFIKKVRTITFKPSLDKNGHQVTLKPLVQQVWANNKEESLDDLVVVKDTSANQTLDERAKTILKNAKKIIFACEAGMGSSAMGAGIVRKLLKDEDIKNLLVVNSAIKDLPPNAEIIITQKTFNDIVKASHPNAYIYLIDQFLNAKEYEKLIDQLNHERKGK